MTIKVGCAAWMFTLPAHNPPYEDAIRTIGELGFDGIELILRDPPDLENYWTPHKVDEINQLCRSYNLRVSEFVLYQNMVGGLADLDPAEKRRALEHFEIGCQMARTFGTDIINIVSPWPAGTSAPHPYLPHYWYINVPGVENGPLFEPKLKVKLPDNFDWNAHWDNYVDSIRQATNIASRYDLRFAVENHAHVMTGHTDSLLRLFDHIPDSNLGANLDIGWAFVQREDIPWAICKLEGKLFHIHARDGDGLACYTLPVGYGTLDWEGILRALKAVKYDGFISLEWSRHADGRRNAKQGLEFMREMIAQVEKG